MKVKTRYAPSNTGFLGLGNCRTALFAYAYARKNNGSLSVRVENTDAQRSTKESLIDIISGLKWLGIEWDFGPSLEDINNDIFPVEHYQSKRNHIYSEFVDKLLKENKAYEQDGAIFFRMPKKDYVLHDMIIGDFPSHADDQKDFVIRRADGTCIFHIANVIDDALFEMTHLIKGNDHLNNQVKHVALFEALGFPIPQYCHLPLVLDDKGAKLSKRRTDQFVLIRDFKKEGYLPSTIINILGLLGWSAPDGRETFDLKYICENFDLKDCGKANARYDPKKLLNFNYTAIKNLPKDEFINECINYGIENHKDLIDKWEFNIDDILSIYQDRSKTLKEPFENGDFFKEGFIFDNQDGIECLKDKIDLLEDFKEIFEAEEVWTQESINNALKRFLEATKWKIGDLATSLRYCLTNRKVSPPIDRILLVLGKDETIGRINNVLKEKLANV